MHDITQALDKLAVAAADQPDVVRIWTVASLANRLGLIAVLTAQEDPVEVIGELGELWVLSVTELLESERHRRGETLRAAHAIVQRLHAATSMSPAASSQRSNET